MNTPEAREVEALAGGDDRQKLIEVVSARLHITTDRIPGARLQSGLSADTAAVDQAVDAILASDWLARRVAALVARAKAEACEQVADEMREQAVLRFDQHGPQDARGAAFWDVYTGLTEGRIARAEGATS